VDNRSSMLKTPPVRRSFLAGLATLLLCSLLGACASFNRHTTTAAFASQNSVSDEALHELFATTGWKLTESEEGFHSGYDDLTGSRYELERQDGNGFATLFIFTARVGRGSVMIDVAEDISGGTMFDLIEGLREIYDAAPSWRDSGVVFCLDHDPRHVLEIESLDQIPARNQELRAEYECRDLRHNPPVE